MTRMKRLVWMLLDSVTREHSIQTFGAVTIYQARNGQTNSYFTSKRWEKWTDFTPQNTSYLHQPRLLPVYDTDIDTESRWSLPSVLPPVPVSMAVYLWNEDGHALHHVFMLIKTRRQTINYANVRRGLPRHRLVSPWLISAAGDSGPEESYRVETE